MFVVDLVTKTFVPAPCSRCGCAAGLGGCSHLRAEYAIFAQLQKVLKKKIASSENWSQEDAALMFPPAMTSTRKIPIPWSYAFHDDDADKELKKIKRQKENALRQRTRDLTSILSDLNSGNPGRSDDEAEDHNGDVSSEDGDYEYCPSDEESLYSSGTDWDEESLMSNLEDDEVDLIESDDVDTLIDYISCGITTSAPSREKMTSCRAGA